MSKSIYNEKEKTVTSKMWKKVMSMNTKTRITIIVPRTKAIVTKKLTSTNNFNQPINVITSLNSICLGP